MSSRKAPLVSVIMPSYNTGKYIAAAIESVVLQSYTNWELIIVNDGSTDNTKEIVSGVSDKRIRYYELERNRGRGYARNYAISKCEGEYVAICDADDINLPSRLELQVAFLEANCEIDIVSAQLLHFSEKSKPTEIYHFPESSEAIRKCYRKGVMGVAHAACMLRRRCFERLRYENDISYNVEDFELFLQLDRFFKMGALPERLVLYRNDLSDISLAKTRRHDLYHQYAIYSATSKLNGSKVEQFETWATSYRMTYKHLLRSSLVYAKVKMKTTLKSLRER